MNSVANAKTFTKYKAWANEVLFSGLQAAPQLERSAEFDFIRLILDHMLVVDCIFQAHLKGVAHGFGAPRGSQASSVEELVERSREVDRWYVEYAETVSESDLLRRSDVRFTDGKVLSMCPFEMVWHVTNHGTYHRGNIGAILQKNGIAPLRDGLPTYLAASSPAP